MVSGLESIWTWTTNSTFKTSQPNLVINVSPPDTESDMYSVIAKHDRKEVQKRTWRPINGPNGSGMHQEPCQINIDGKSVYCPYITTDKHIRYFIFDGSFLTPERPSVDCSACR